jgi:lipoprotein-releasing system ATP-binding protein
MNDKVETKLHVLKGIHFEVYEGEIVSITGASGSGKSTFLHILGGLDKPSEGLVQWGENNIAALNDETLSRLRSRYVGFIFQFHHLLPEFTALENVMIPLMIQGKSMREAEQQATALLTKVQVDHRLHHKPSELSGGEQQRVAVARALANNPKMILADEPTGNLDSVHAQELHDLLWKLNQEQRQTMVLVTHNKEFAKDSHRLFRMEDGRLHQV